jgi:DNA-binding NarL/FixJ family response regulator
MSSSCHYRLGVRRRSVSNILDQTYIANRAQAALYAREHGLV